MTLRLLLVALLVLLPVAASAQPAPGRPSAAPSEPPPAASPTEALFNAINLGDLDMVRAAVAAGADLGARNVLGLTPLDLAVDLGRAEIAFYLMSLGRMGVRGPIAEPPAAPAPRGAPPPRRTTLPPAPPAATLSRAPLWQGGGGTPVPEAGFLGFDAGRPEGARPPAAPRR